MTTVPALADPDIAAATFAAHLERALASEPAVRSGWTATIVSPLEAVIHLTARRLDGTTDLFHLRLRAQWYDQFPPQAEFVAPPRDPDPSWWNPSTESRWMPRINNGVFPDGRFAFHPAYTFGTEQRQLICCSMSFDYYISGHGPTEAQTWRQGRHTLVALLTRVQEALLPPAYEGPAGDHDS
jgi:hypothetical protein